MGKQEAYNILVQATAQLNTTREVHQQISQALQVISTLITDKAEPTSKQVDKDK